MLLTLAGAESSADRDSSNNKTPSEDETFVLSGQMREPEFEDGHSQSLLESMGQSQQQRSSTSSSPPKGGLLGGMFGVWFQSSETNRNNSNTSNTMPGSSQNEENNSNNASDEKLDDELMPEADDKAVDGDDDNDINNNIEVTDDMELAVHMVQQVKDQDHISPSSSSSSPCQRTDEESGETRQPVGSKDKLHMKEPEYMKQNDTVTDTNLPDSIY